METSDTLAAAVDAPGFLFIFFHFPLRFTPRYDILNCMSGRENGREERPQKRKTKPKKNGNLFWGGRRL
jgi:hypothetical protein